MASLHSLDTSGSVLYVGTFTKMLFNALRLGFIVLPERLVPLFEMARSLMDRLGHLLEIENTLSGMRTVGWIRSGESDIAVAQRAVRLGIEVVPLSTFSTQHHHRPGLILGFAGSNERELKRGVSVLKKALAD